MREVSKSNATNEQADGQNQSHSLMLGFILALIRLGSFGPLGGGKKREYCTPYTHLAYFKAAATMRLSSPRDSFENLDKRFSDEISKIVLR